MTRRTLSLTLVPAVALLLSGCHLMFGPEGGQMDWWTYCDEHGCTRCNIDGCDVPDSHCDPDLPYETCPAGTFCDPERRVCRGKTCTGARDCGDGYICDNGVCLPQRTPCDNHEACGSGGYCNNGQCKPSGTCQKDSDCAALGNFVCSPSGTCVPGKPVDKSCSDSASCGGGMCVDGKCGTCSGDCGGGQTCEFNRHCGPVRACLDGQCTNMCNNDLQCGSGQVCKNKYCQPQKVAECKYTADCGSGKLCVNGLCLADCSDSGKCLSANDRCSGPIQLGKGTVRVCQADYSAQLECKVTSQCKGGESCINGICRTSCNADKDCAACDDGPVCGPGGYCMTNVEISAKCTKNSQCSGGKSCLNGYCVSI